MRGRFKLIASLTLGLVLLGACGGDDDGAIPMTGNRPKDVTEETTTTAPAEEGTFPTTIEAANGPVEIAAMPEAIVSLSPTATEMLFAIEAGDQVVAVDEESDFPREAPKTDLSGFDPNIEAISGHEPDLVLVEGTDAISGLEALDIPVIQLPAAKTLDDSYNQLTQLGQATGKVSKAQEVIDTMKADIDEIVAKVPTRDAPVPIYHELDDQHFSVTGASFIGQLYDMAGLTNIADTAGGGQEYPQLNPEAIVQANPEWIFLAYGGDDAVSQVKSRPGWNNVKAVANDHVVSLDPDIASRWGPRAVDLLETIVETTAGGT